MGADGAATLGNVAGLRTVLQPMAKLSIVRQQVIVGVSGPVGLGQLYVDRVDHLWDSIREEFISEVCRKLRSAFLQDAQVALQVASLARQVIGQIAQESAFTQTLVALAPRRSPQLVQFDYQCSPEVATDDLPFVAIGSGQGIADPFLAFLRRVFWKDTLPSLSGGIFAVMWTLLHAIETALGGISRPIQIATLSVKDTQPSAAFLSEAELKEHEVARSEAEDHLRNFRTEQQPTGAEAEPPTTTS